MARVEPATSWPPGNFAHHCAATTPIAVTIRKNQLQTLPLGGSTYPGCKQTFSSIDLLTQVTQPFPLMRF